MREFISVQVDDVVLFKKKLLSWAYGFSKCCVLDSNQGNNNEHELIAAIDSADEITPSGNSFEELNKFYNAKNDWLFGHLAYDLKNETENLVSENYDGVKFPEMH